MHPHLSEIDIFRPLPVPLPYLNLNHDFRIMYPYSYGLVFGPSKVDWKGLPFFIAIVYALEIRSHTLAVLLLELCSEYSVHAELRESDSVRYAAGVQTSTIAQGQMDGGGLRARADGNGTGASCNSWSMRGKKWPIV